MRVVVLLVLLSFADSSFAFRCGNKLVSVGDVRYEVKAICGAPDDITRSTLYRSVSNNQIVNCQSLDVHGVGLLDDAPKNRPRSCLTLVEDKLAVRVDVEIWLYDFGKNRFMRQLHLENGQVVRIDKLGYGVKPRQ